MTDRLRPLFVVRPKTISRADLRRIEKLTGMCVVECEDPDSARFIEPPFDAGLDVQARAALSLMRMVIASQGPFSRGDLTTWFVNRLLDSKPAQPVQKVKK